MIKFFLWLVTAMAFGVFLSTVRIAGLTPAQRLQRTWNHSKLSQKIDDRVDDLKDSVRDSVDNLKDRITGDAKRKPSEHHTARDREAIDRLVAKRNRGE